QVSYGWAFSYGDHWAIAFKGSVCGDPRTTPWSVSGTLARTSHVDGKTNTKQFSWKTVFSGTTAIDPVGDTVPYGGSNGYARFLPGLDVQNPTLDFQAGYNTGKAYDGETVTPASHDITVSMHPLASCS